MLGTTVPDAAGTTKQQQEQCPCSGHGRNGPDRQHEASDLHTAALRSSPIGGPRHHLHNLGGHTNSRLHQLQARKIPFKFPLNANFAITNYFLKSPLYNLPQNNPPQQRPTPLWHSGQAARKKTFLIGL